MMEPSNATWHLKYAEASFLKRFGGYKDSAKNLFCFVVLLVIRCNIQLEAWRA